MMFYNDLKHYNYKLGFFVTYILCNIVTYETHNIADVVILVSIHMVRTWRIFSSSVWLCFAAVITIKKSWYTTCTYSTIIWFRTRFLFDGGLFGVKFVKATVAGSSAALDCVMLYSVMSVLKNKMILTFIVKEAYLVDFVLYYNSI